MGTGLPVAEIWGGIFLTEESRDLRPFQGDRSLLVLATTAYASTVAVDLRLDERVVVAEHRGTDNASISTSVLHFAAGVSHCAAYGDAVAQDVSRRERELDILERRLRETEPGDFRGNGGWWESLVADCRRGVVD